MNCAARTYATPRPKKFGQLFSQDLLALEQGDLGLGGIADQTLIFCESHVRWGGVEALIVGNDLNLAITPDADAAVGGAEAVRPQTGPLVSNA